MSKQLTFEDGRLPPVGPTQRKHSANVDGDFPVEIVRNPSGPDAFVHLQPMADGLFESGVCRQVQLIIADREVTQQLIILVLTKVNLNKELQI